jgi:hypothetical protein
VSKTTAVLDITKRPAQVMHINTRIEKHGDSSVLAADIRVGGIHLEADELNALMDDKHAHASLFKAANGKGKAAEPMFRQLKSLELIDKFENCAALIGLGLTDIDVEFEDVKLARIVLEPQVGGLTLMECTVQTEIEDTDDVARLLEHLQSEGSAAILIGAKAVPKGAKAQKSLDFSPTAGKPADQAKGTDDMPASTH